jgi:hypothetical protein
MPLLDDALTVAAIRLAAAAAAEGQADPAARIPLQALLAQHHVLLEQGARTGALGEHAVADTVALKLDEVRDQIAPDDPVAGRHHVDRRHRFRRRARRAVGDRVPFDQAVVGKAPVLAVDLEVGVEIADPVVHGREMVGAADHVEGMLAAGRR